MENIKCIEVNKYRYYSNATVLIGNYFIRYY